eukprot:3208998-Rhodomonas_salina.1
MYVQAGYPDTRGPELVSIETPLNRKRALSSDESQQKYPAGTLVPGLSSPGYLYRVHGYTGTH